MSRPAQFKRDYPGALIAYLNRRGLTDTGSRRHSESHPRQVAMYIARQDGLSLPAIAKTFRRDHTTVLHACRSVAERLASANKAPDVRLAINEMRAAL